MELISPPPAYICYHYVRFSHAYPDECYEYFKEMGGLAWYYGQVGRNRTVEGAVFFYVNKYDCTCKQSRYYCNVIIVLLLYVLYTYT